MEVPFRGRRRFCGVFDGTHIPSSLSLGYGLRPQNKFSEAADSGIPTRGETDPTGIIA